MIAGIIPGVIAKFAAPGDGIAEGGITVHVVIPPRDCAVLVCEGIASTGVDPLGWVAGAAACVAVGILLVAAHARRARPVGPAAELTA